jgi:hypothetical protein
VSRFRGNEEACPVCGLVYKDFRVILDAQPLTYAEVRMLLWVADPDYTKWKYKRRRTVLGLWHQLKQTAWKEHLLECERIQMYREARERHPEEQAELDDLSDIPF